MEVVFEEVDFMQRGHMYRGWYKEVVVCRGSHYVEVVLCRGGHNAKVVFM